MDFELMIELTDKNEVNVSLIMDGNINILPLKLHFSFNKIIKIFKDANQTNESLRKDGNMIKNIVKTVDSYQPLVGQLNISLKLSESFIKRCESEIDHKYPGLFTPRYSEVTFHIPIDSVEQFLMSDKEYNSYVSNKV